MNERYEEGVAAVLRAITNAESENFSVSNVLLESAEDAIFRRLVLAPPSVVATRAVKNFQDAGPTSGSDEEVHRDWQAALTVIIDWFEMDTTGALRDECETFIDACGRVFGVEVGVVPSLLISFAAMSDPEKVGVFLAIEESESFSYLQRHIDEAPDDTPFLAPNLAIRKLVRETYSDV